MIIFATVILGILVREIFLILAGRDMGVLFENADEVLEIAEADIVSTVVDFVVT
ncbi:hypothetical protein M5X06_08910 [Paenibacillus alvei]|uniref:Uncharacterized protein n=1 Tax=Paenibacillus alvei TaxID=44250 RepID=A0ABT4H5U4_PAEAL|nr:hypothetical protein [Paenibacillus alvei]MCY9766952.1 hypothetical protein [Paenibacillus alvei]